jgi:membrane protease YdiL (CAAX protease family)
MDEAPRPSGLSFLGAAAWSIAATAILQVFAVVGLAVKPGADLDIVGGVACQAAAYLLAIFLFVRVYEPHRALSDVLAVRSTSAALCASAIALGLAIQIPAAAVAAAIERRWPHTATELAAQAQELTATTTGRRVGVVLAVVVAGPLVEEMFFRGALYRGLRLRHPRGLATIGVATFFALAHQDARYFVPILMVGLAITHLRAISGSLLPGLLVHAAFNAASLLPALGGSMEPEDAAAPVPRSLMIVGTAASAAMLLVCKAIASRSAMCALAREADEAPPPALGTTD